MLCPYSFRLCLHQRILSALVPSNAWRIIQYTNCLWCASGFNCVQTRREKTWFTSPTNWIRRRPAKSACSYHRVDSVSGGSTRNSECADWATRAWLVEAERNFTASGTNRVNNLNRIQPMWMTNESTLVVRTVRNRSRYCVSHLLLGLLQCFYSVHNIQSSNCMFVSVSVCVCYKAILAICVFARRSLFVNTRDVNMCAALLL